MCVIAVVETVRPTEAEVRAMWDANDHGGGVAWREGGPNGPVVKWKKGLSEEEMIELNRDLPLPYVMHFRIASSDTSKSMLACHPFPVNPDTPSDFEGVENGYVLFHNGYWTGWKDKILDLAARREDAALPSGPWSDSRGLAWYSSILGFGVLEVISEKVVCLGPSEIEIFGSWSYHKSQPADKEGFLVSNLGWIGKIHKPYEKAGGTSHQDFFPGRQQHQIPASTVAQTTPASGESSDLQHGTAGKEGDKREGIQAEAEGDLSTNRAKCHYCHQVKRGYNNAENHFVCYQCWAVERSVCGICKTVRTNTLRVRDNVPVCATCNETNGKETTYLKYPPTVLEHQAQQMMIH